MSKQASEASKIPGMPKLNIAETPRARVVTPVGAGVLLSPCRVNPTATSDDTRVEYQVQLASGELQWFPSRDVHSADRKREEVAV
jgi:hypothetical protein